MSSVRSCCAPQAVHGRSVRLPRVHQDALDVAHAAIPARESISANRKGCARLRRCTHRRRRIARYSASLRPKLSLERGMASSDHTMVSCQAAASGCHAHVSASRTVVSRFDALTMGTMNSRAQGAGPQQRCARGGSAWRERAGQSRGVGCAPARPLAPCRVSPAASCVLRGHARPPAAAGAPAQARRRAAPAPADGGPTARLPSREPTTDARRAGCAETPGGCGQARHQRPAQPRSAAAYATAISAAAGSSRRAAPPCTAEWVAHGRRHASSCRPRTPRDTG